MTRRRDEVVAAYRRLGSLARTAKAVGASKTTAWRVLDRAGVLRRCPKYSNRLVVRARQLYREGKGYREVARALREETGGRGPSDHWVYKRLRADGSLRRKRA